ncbi:MAG: type II toxin-antitoxin system ParD family antitoxin [Oxalobacteraceae bacterium]|nr:MAG: type II toxin-antitoxin system ParD family antitoxin [Oxalobacteraceae bacterium]
MAQMHISLPDDLETWAKARVAEGRYDGTGEYILDLVRRDREHEQKRRALQAAIDEGRASGVSERDPFDYLDDLRDQLRTASAA